MSEEKKEFPHILLAVSGCTQAEVTPRLVHNLKHHPDIGTHEVIVAATEPALAFFEKNQVEQLTGRRVFVNHEDGTEEFPVPHINLADWADMLIVYPASANTIAKCAHGICDNVVTHLVMTCRCPIYFGPTMNDLMSQNPIYQKNRKILEEHGYEFVGQEMANITVRATGKVEQKLFCTERMVLAAVDEVLHPEEE